jgi:hypothetical protein
MAAWAAGSTRPICLASVVSGARLLVAPGGRARILARHPVVPRDGRYSVLKALSSDAPTPNELVTTMSSPEQSASGPSILVSSQKLEVRDQKFERNVAEAAFANRLFTRLVAKDRRFSKVDFRYSTFDACYLRNCVFEDCDFTGCRFVSTNLHGSSFAGCKFDYATFEKTDIDVDVLSSGCPGTDNLTMRFARSLRVNYQQLGNADAANKAIAVELDATGVHLEKSWRSRESYYRKKYAGARRAVQFLRWFQFKTLDWIWGNGESVGKLLRAVAVVIGAIAVIDVMAFGNPRLVASYWEGLITAPSVLLGVEAPKSYPTLYLTVIVFVRLVLLGFFMAIILKRFNRRRDAHLRIRFHLPRRSDAWLRHRSSCDYGW